MVRSYTDEVVAISCSMYCSICS